MRILTIHERKPAPRSNPYLPESLAHLYGGDLIFSSAPHGRPVIVGNFVQTLDGIISLKIPGQSGGGEISGFNEEDRFIMALLRAGADAVMVASGTLHEDSGHVRIPGFIYPSLEPQWVDFRAHLGKRTQNPLNVIVSGSGNLNLAEKTFSTENLQTVVLTTRQGETRLQRIYGQQLSHLTDVRVLPGDDELEPADIAAALYVDYGVRILLHEGGAQFFSAFLRRRLIDDLFLTIAPQIVGSGTMRERPNFADRASFGIQDALWSRLLTVKVAEGGSHVYLHYRFGTSG
ncbi:MAG TPA: RibD family protein [Nitrospiraceae bacterium]|nr:RibD family protein [Nitrospiraceae bacterium]